jgi:hypothetical protein
MNPLFVAAIGSILRHILTYGAGYLVARGVWTGNESTMYVEALTLFVIGQGWSLYQKWDTHKALDFLRSLAFHSSSPSNVVPFQAPPSGGSTVVVVKSE